ncbi:hypothetical protein HDU86_006728 [Geranomyces michiganensis]|nr:hypothetical protein HDU86_006728 [Geranomyces michiganensis]
MRISLLTLLAAVGSASAQVLHLPTNTIWQNLLAYNQDVDSGNNTYHMSIVNRHAAALQGILSSPEKKTVFFPSDHSFDNIRGSDPAYYQQLTTNNALMTATLQYFITEGMYDIFNNPPSHATLPSILKPATLQAQIVPPGPDAPAGWVASAITATGDPVEVYIVHTMPSSNGILYVTGYAHVLHAPPEAIAAAAGGVVVPSVSLSLIASSTISSLSTSSSSSVWLSAASTTTVSVTVAAASSTTTTAPVVQTTATASPTRSGAASTASAAAGNVGSAAAAGLKAFSLGTLFAAAAAAAAASALILTL